MMRFGQCLQAKVVSFGKGGESDERKNILDCPVHSDSGLSAACGSIGIDSITIRKMRGEQR